MASKTQINTPTIFKYIAQDKSGAVVNGKLKAIDEESALQQINRLGLEPFSVSPYKEPFWEKDIKIFDRVPVLAIYTFTRQLSIMLKAGVPLVDALDSMRGESTNPKLNKAIDQVISDVSGGYTLSSAMKKHPTLFNTMFVNIVKAGESTGALDEVLLQLAGFINHDLRLSMGIKSAVRYPAIVVSITMLVGIYAVTFILPRFSSLFSSTKIELPLPTRILLGTDQFLQLYFYHIVIVVAVLIFAFLRYIKTKKGKLQYDKFLFFAPIFGPINQKMSLSRFCHVFETLNRAGVPILEALDISGKTVGNSYIQSRLSNVKSEVEMGRKVARSLNNHTKGIFPPHVLKMINVGEESGAMDDMLKEIATMTDIETEDLVKKLTATIEPVITVFMGIMILTLSLSIFLPIWDMYEALANN
ncbi:MAG: type II secretion system F family protein [Candidatus Marinimicrobia bacterium]|jgi:type II secretory pathway component PulF|nr:type II secretion system F family protein [Candidatus Neomarinimicrobiota bacterium]MBT3502696.1 type II secretion system F family protein [Candidatus Neomarinimicrobiota bacterium]MBT3840427.1 type II secretion system F family protein [Candidatus Neomarinimicrobiota bacterium]MBT4000113.1 type II secretion system F family protein [Candidatus Neomarinimicrobiota bacterium]MBT4957142.1 type II secretion system F family protein [Candidatus Neomarinimicrobiota bacterium]